MPQKNRILNFQLHEKIVIIVTVLWEAMERFPSLRYIREAYGLNECGIITLTYPREKKNSVPGGLKAIDLPDDHVMPVGWTNMYSQIKIINRYLCIFIFFSIV